MREGRGSTRWLQEPLPRRRKQEVATACGRGRRARALAYWREEEGDREELVGWAATVLGQLGAR